MHPFAGWNGFGQLGDGSTTDRALPVAVSADGTWSAVSAGTYHTCGLKTDGALFCWGELGVCGWGASSLVRLNVGRCLPLSPARPLPKRNPPPLLPPQHTHTYIHIHCQPPIPWCAVHSYIVTLHLWCAHAVALRLLPMLQQGGALFSSFHTLSTQHTRMRTSHPHHPRPKGFHRVLAVTALVGAGCSPPRLQCRV